MWFPNWTGWKSIKVILGILTACAAGIAAAPAYQGTKIGGAANIAGVVLGMATTTVVMLSGTNLGPTMATNLTPGAVQAANDKAIAKASIRP